MDDEWFITFLLFEISKQFNCIIRYFFFIYLFNNLIKLILIIKNKFK